jgi:DNA-directed RNA polymerase subunit RPC12/RpoP
MLIPHITEVYYCGRCEKRFMFPEVEKNWECPHCDMPVSIKIQVGDRWKSCLRLKPNELKIGRQVTLDKENYHTVINVTPHGNGYIVALKDYGVKICHKDEYFLVIDGAWQSYYES